MLRANVISNNTASVEHMLAHIKSGSLAIEEIQNRIKKALCRTLYLDNPAQATKGVYLQMHRGMAVWR